MIRSLFPAISESLPLKGLYLALNLHRQAGEGELFIYSNYVASLDGRISLYNEETGDFEVPESIANARDWRLYQELAAQSDILITSARYFRQFSKGTAQDMLPIGSKFDDLKQWRLDQGLKAQPDIAIISNSLDIPIEVLKQVSNRNIIVMTSGKASIQQRAVLEAAGIKVMEAGANEVEGARLKHLLANLGYRSAYMIAGPAVHGTLIRSRVLDRLFLTTRLTLLGSKGTHGFYDGNEAAEMRLLTLYMDEIGEQLLAQYELERSHG